MPIDRSKYNWFFRYRLYHLPFWFGYHTLWWVLTIGSVSQVATSIFHSYYFVKFSFYVVFQAIGVYFNLYFLIPRFLEKGRYVQYIYLALLTIACTAALIVPGYYLSAWLSGRSFEEMFGIDPRRYWYFFQINTLPSSAASMTLAMSVKLTKNWIQTRQRERLLEKEKLETELKFLKSQFNPHFLFNTINSIFVLIHKNPDIASESLAKFSELLRYQLYECNEQQIPLRQELSYLGNFIELEKLRQEENVVLTTGIEEPLSGNLSGDLMIPPFILMPFIENAFKHVSRGTQRDNWIKIHAYRDRDQFVLEVANSVLDGSGFSGESAEFNSRSIRSNGGIGLKNVQRRLDLIYPGQHELTILSQEETFEVRLCLRLYGQKQTGHTAEPLETGLIPIAVPV